MANKTRVLILGGGFGGLYAALEFEKRRDPQFEVTVVNREQLSVPDKVDNPEMTGARETVRSRTAA